MKADDINRMRAVIDQFQELERMSKNLDKSLSTNIQRYEIKAIRGNSVVSGVTIPIAEAQHVRNLLSDLKASIQIEMENMKPTSDVVVKEFSEDDDDSVLDDE